MGDLIDRQVSGGIVLLTLNLPSKANALTVELLTRLEAELSHIENDPSIRAMVLTGAGDKFFCAGGAFNDWGKLHARDMGRQYIRTTNRVIDRIEMLDMLTVSWLNGAAIGGGLELALATDMRLVHPGAKLFLPELSIGAVPGMRGIERLSAVIGTGRARELVLTGRKLDAQTAIDWGLAGAVCDDLTEVETFVMSVIESTSGDALATAKQMFRALAGGVSGAHAVHEIAGTASKYSDDGREGVRALMEKRKPDFGSRGESDENDL